PIDKARSFFCTTMLGRCHAVAEVVKAALQELEVLEHPPYPPDLAPTDCHLFRSFSNQMGALPSTMKRTSKTGSPSTPKISQRFLVKRHQ
ncbi:hypothetical protein ANCDUO_26164, partial [Ancylostoma duodenale]